jgi:hypothetical protein
MVMTMTPRDLETIQDPCVFIEHVTAFHALSNSGLAHNIQMNVSLFKFSLIFQSSSHSTKRNENGHVSPISP